ncbi:hypothetical protein [Streptomyces sp. NPDC001388]|uniref:hypothetical protein n=1 Tax=Streptomyces sp. NPDC001388 TaxID=3364568 RepID=UPI0036C8B019
MSAAHPARLAVRTPQTTGPLRDRLTDILAARLGLPRCHRASCIYIPALSPALSPAPGAGRDPF